MQSICGILSSFPLGIGVLDRELNAAHAQVLRPEPRGNSEIHLVGASGTATIGDVAAERLSISLRKTGKRFHAIFKPGLWPMEVQSLPAQSHII
jgi:hypothetical protein